MRLLVTTALLLSWFCGVARAKAVFAHFMVSLHSAVSVAHSLTNSHQVGNTQNYTKTDWSQDIQLAKEAGIDAFAMNMAYDDPVNEPSLADAFYMAGALGFHLFFSFDYAGNGPWPQQTVISYISKYGSNSAYYHYNGKPFVSTFEGPDNAADWVNIKAATGCFFIPDWSSLGAQPAAEKAGGVADGLFSWAAWAWGDRPMDTYVDASYHQFLGGKPYMMPASPWFYTNLPGYGKNWMWAGEDAWPSRWQQILWWQPEFVQIISWNDYGESHHIGPLRSNAMAAFDIGRAPFNFALDHEGWRAILPFVTAMYKNNVTTITEEVVTGWYRPQPKAACSRGETTGNTALQLQYEFAPAAIVQDAVFLAAVLGSPADVTVTIGGASASAKWSNTPDGGAGLYWGSMPTGGKTGRVQIDIVRGGSNIITMDGDEITTTCSPGGLENWNAVVGMGSSSSSIAVTPPATHETVCINGTGLDAFQGLCSFACSYAYCPSGACRCTKMGKARTQPKATGVKGYPVAGEDSNYSGLCMFSCNFGYCPPERCGPDEVPLTISSISPFTPPTCTSGVAHSDQFTDLCDFACKHGFCPINVCACYTSGTLDLMSPTSTSNATTIALKDYGLCAFACSRGYCPDGMCFNGSTDPLDYGWGDDYVPALDDFLDMEDPNFVRCDPAKRPATLDDLANTLDPSVIPPICWNRWALSLISESLETLESDYEDAASGGYDDKFGYYVQWVKDSISPSLQSYMAFDGGAGNKYFHCTWKAGVNTGSSQCPPSEKIWEGDWTYEITYELTDAAGFNASIQADLGIDPGWVTFGDTNTLIGCQTGGETTPGTGNRPCLKIYEKKYGFPMKGDNVDVPNPKDLLQAALPKIEALQDTVTAMYIEIGLNVDKALVGDMVTAVSVPVFMLESAVDQMKTIKDIGAEVAEQKKKDLILTILGIALLVLPFVGEAADALIGGAVGISRIAAVVGVLDLAANAGLSVFEVVNDPLSAPFAILGLLAAPAAFAGRGERDVFDEAASARRALKTTDLVRFGSTFVEKDAKVQNIVKACVRG